jgi:hypothetical protein
MQVLLRRPFGIVAECFGKNVFLGRRVQGKWEEIKLVKKKLFHWAKLGND